MFCINLLWLGGHYYHVMNRSMFSVCDFDISDDYYNIQQVPVITHDALLCLDGPSEHGLHT